MCTEHTFQNQEKVPDLEWAEEPRREGVRVRAALEYRLFYWFKRRLFENVSSPWSGESRSGILEFQEKTEPRQTASVRRNAVGERRER